MLTMISILYHQNMTPDSEILCDLIQEVINTFSNHAGISPDTAELAYITEASQLEGYGQENYPAKVKTGRDKLSKKKICVCVFSYLFVIMKLVIYLSGIC